MHKRQFGRSSPHVHHPIHFLFFSPLLALQPTMHFNHGPSRPSHGGRCDACQCAFGPLSSPVCPPPLFPPSLHFCLFQSTTILTALRPHHTELKSVILPLSRGSSSFPFPKAEAAAWRAFTSLPVQYSSP